MIPRPSGGERKARPSGGARRVLHGVARAVDVVDAVVRPDDGVVLLSYHQVGGPRAGTVNLDAGAFDDQMAMLTAQHRTGPVITLDQALAALDVDQSGAGPDAATDAVVITFDDGTADFVEQALPILVKHVLPVTLYLATAPVEEGRSFWDDGTVLSWAALGEALSTGLVAIGSHTHTHALLDRAPAEVVDYELDRSVGLIGDRLGVDARHFAYPRALPPSPTADRAVRSRFASAARAGGRPNPIGRSDPWQLWRTPVVRDDTTADVARKARGGLRLEGAVRERFDIHRYAPG